MKMGAMTVSRSDVLGIQSTKLEALLRAVLATNPFYRAKLDGLLPQEVSPQTISELPFTTKNELAEDQKANPPYGTNLTYPLDDYVRLHSTSGTTGEPLRWLDTAASWQWFLDCWREIFQAAGVGAKDRVFVAFSFGPFIGFWTAFEAAQQIGALTLTGGALTTEQRLDHLLQNRATVLVCTPTYALRLAESARSRGIDLAASDIRVTLHAGEPGASVANVRNRIEDSWGARCIDHAGATEVGAWGVTGRNRDHMRILETEFIAEVIDPKTAEPATADSSGVVAGELVLTNLGRLGSPVIRYRTGDLVEMIPAGDRCSDHPDGEPFSHLRGGILARADGMVVVRGVNVYPSAIENLIRAFPEIDEFQVTVDTVDEMAELRIEIEVTAGEREVIAASLAELVHRNLSLRPMIQLAECGSLPRYELKAKRFRVT